MILSSVLFDSIVFFHEVFGAGHVALNLYKVAHNAGFDVIVVATSFVVFEYVLEE